MARTSRFGSAWLHHGRFWKIKTDFITGKESVSGCSLGQAHELLWERGVNILMAHTDERLLRGGGFLCWDSHSSHVVKSIIYRTEMKGTVQTRDLFLQVCCKFGQMPSIDLQLVNVFKACLAIMCARRRFLGWGVEVRAGVCPFKWKLMF